MYTMGNTERKHKKLSSAMHTQTETESLGLPTESQLVIAEKACFRSSTKYRIAIFVTLVS